MCRLTTKDLVILLEVSRRAECLYRKLCSIYRRKRKKFSVYYTKDDITNELYLQYLEIKRSEPELSYKKILAKAEKKVFSKCYQNLREVQRLREFSDVEFMEEKDEL